ncbi:MAG: hypothetical protein V9E98_06005 [Candidatus Nanopelagicales bacterium]
MRRSWRSSHNLSWAAGIRSSSPSLVVLVVVVRTATYWLVRELRRRGHLRERTVILGAGQVARDLGVYMVTDGSYGCTLVGYVDSDPALPDSALPASNLGPSENMATIVSDERVDQVIIAFTVAPEDQLVPIIQTCDRAEVSMYIVPRLFELTAQRGASDEIDGIPLQHLHRAPFRSPTWWLKRAIDITVSGTRALAAVAVAPSSGTHQSHRGRTRSSLPAAPGGNR